MKLFVLCKKLLPVAALLLATTAFAANKTSCKLAEAVTVNGHQLTPGDYEFQWDGSGPSVNLSISSKGKLVATVPAHVVEQPRSADKTTMRMRENNDGTRTLNQIHFAGKKYALAFGDDSAAGPAAQNGGNANVSKP